MNQKIPNSSGSPRQTPVPPHNETQKPLLLIALAMLLLGSLGGYLIGSQKYTLPVVNNPDQVGCTLEAKVCPDGSSVGRVPPNCDFAPCPTNPQTTPNPIADGKTYSNSDYGLTFVYPFDYTLQENFITSENYYISVLSPLLPSEKGFAVKNGELKVEILISKSSPNDNLEKFTQSLIQNNVDSGTLLKQKETKVSGIPAVYQEWEGMGASVKHILIHNGFRFLILKYPLTTTPQRQEEFDQVLSTFRFTN